MTLNCENIHDVLLVLAGGIIGLFSNLLIEIYRNKIADNNAFDAIRGEIESNIESATGGALTVYLWSNDVYKANLNRLRPFKSNISKVVKFYFKIENYKDIYLQYLEIMAELKKDNTNKALQNNANSESRVLSLLTKEIETIGTEILNRRNDEN